jgi:hypothetical protein
MKNTILVAALAAFSAAFALDGFTVSRLERKINERRIANRGMVVAQGGQTNVITTYRQSGVEWTETNALRHVQGVIASKKYSRLSLYAALVRLGKWDVFEAWLKDKTVDGLNAYTSFMLANELSDNHPMFNSLLKEAKTVLDMDDATVEAILAQCGI